MSVNNLKKQIEKLGDAVEDYHHTGSRCFLVTDSKGRYLSRHLERRDYLDIIWKSGARVEDAALLSRLEVKLKDLKAPLVLLWLGTCDFTKLERNKTISLRNISAEDVFSKMVKMHTSVLQINSSARVQFLQCPVYSMKTWNTLKGFSDSDDKDLEDLVAKFNELVDSYNSMYTPKFSLDLEKNTKTKKGSRSRYYFNYNLYIDGIHPGPEIAQLWILKIRKLIKNLQD